MVQFLASLPTYAQDEASKLVVRKIREYLGEDVEGVCYYKHPVLRLDAGVTAELTLLTRILDPLAIRCLPYQLEDIQEIDDELWTVNGEEIESPLLSLGDFVTVLDTRFRKDRAMRERVHPRAILAFPLIAQSDFRNQFGNILDEIPVLWAGSDFTTVAPPNLPSPLSDDEWRRARSIFQGAAPLTKAATGISSGSATTLGPAIKQLDREIALLDSEQEKVALQIAPGPQCIRGLAGTGKTVLLAMKAANIHLHFPEARILFTFHTQSLYNQAKALITKFYRFYSDYDPDWDLIHVRHAWGGKSREGVYSDLCFRHGQQPLNFNQARELNSEVPFQACCDHALTIDIESVYDFILVDEAQDFPQSFFPVLYRLGIPSEQANGAPKPRIYWAYDELQNLTAIDKEMQAEYLFGKDADGNPYITLEGEDYEGEIEKELILRKSYRCSQQVLMLAHGIGLGLYNQKGGCVQMLDDEASWDAIGYTLESGSLQKDSQVLLYRHPDNSPNRINQIYQGPQPLVMTQVFPDREHELDWIAAQIHDDISQGVQPDQIIVIFLDPKVAKNPLASLQVKLLSQFSVSSSIPGLVNDASEFMEKGKITLSAVFRAKGNEAYIVYVCGFESLYDYVEAIENRNRAFTAITRSKAWVRITGVGRSMELAQREIKAILTDVPRFRFRFPDMAMIKRLDAETNKRRQQVTKAQKQATELAKLDARVLASMDPKVLEDLMRRIEEAKNENN